MNNEIHMAGPWITEQEEEILLDAFRNGWYGKQAYSYCEKFEKAFAGYHNRKYAVMTPNCTQAIHLLLAALDIKDNDEVIVPDCTWIASAAAITYQRATTVFSDIDYNNWCISANSLEKKITNKTKAVIIVNLYGNMADMDALKTITDKHKIYLIEDAAESLGSTYKNIKSGKFGIGSVFSFHRTKTITTGEGGILLLDDQDLYNRCRFLRDHGRAPGTYYNTEVTFKYMPSNMQAAIGYAQFLRLKELVDKKRWIWHTYQKYLANIPDLQLNPEPDNCYNGVWCTTLVFGKSHNITKTIAMEKLAELNLPTRPFFYPLSSLPAYGSQANKYSNLNPISYDVSNRGIILPSAFSVTEDQIIQICNGIEKILNIN